MAPPFVDAAPALPDGLALPGAVLELLALVEPWRRPPFDLLVWVALVLLRSPVWAPDWLLPFPEDEVVPVAAVPAGMLDEPDADCAMAGAAAKAAITAGMTRNVDFITNSKPFDRRDTHLHPTALLKR